jgi:hypothetical protein
VLLSLTWAIYDWVWLILRPSVTEFDLHYELSVTEFDLHCNWVLLSMTCTVTKFYWVWLVLWIGCYWVWLVLNLSVTEFDILWQKVTEFDLHYYWVLLSLTCAMNVTEFDLYYECYWVWLALWPSVNEFDLHYDWVLLSLTCTMTECYWVSLVLWLSVIDFDLSYDWVLLSLTWPITECYWVWIVPPSCYLASVSPVVGDPVLDLWHTSDMPSLTESLSSYSGPCIASSSPPR